MKDGTVGAELGVFRGVFSEFILKNTKIEKLYMVDAWDIFVKLSDGVMIILVMEHFQHQSLEKKQKIERKALKRKENHTSCVMIS